MNFREEYLKYHKSLTDSSEKYARMLAFALLGHNCGRQSFVSITPRNIFLNFFMLIIGDSTISRKSTAVKDVASPLISEKDLLPNHYSPERLYDRYGENPHRILIDGEFSNILKKANRKNSFMSNIVEDFEEMYDCPHIFKSDTRGHGEIVARNIFLSIVGCTTPEAIETNVTTEMLQGGFYPRFYIVWEQKPNPQPRRDLPDDIETKRFELQQFLKKLRCSRYRFNFMPKNALDSWQRSAIRDDPENTSIIGRYEAYLIKISALIALNIHLTDNGFSEHVENLYDLDGHISNIIQHQRKGETYSTIPETQIDVNMDHFSEARDIVFEALKDARELKDRISEERIIGKMLKACRGMAVIKYSDFLRRSRLTAKDFKEGLHTLIDMHKICLMPEISGGEMIKKYCIAEKNRCSSCTASNQSSEVVSDDDRESD